jgi:hypothetical protein
VSTTLAVLATTMRLVASHPYAEGAPPGFSGGFTEQSCHACHFDAEPNTGPGRVLIDGAPARFTAGERYTLTITLTRAEMKRGGFQLTARFKDSGAQAGTLAPGGGDSDRVSVESQSNVQYAGQKVSGAVASAGVSRWTVEWTAPKAGGIVIFHVAANAANGNESADGDLVYTVSTESAPPP